ncbi:hypothetical protein RY831_31190 [Noviherbaspirillum sp. CPCC 100848]|uniref:Uncharacterized protein n=1 Tax=Noviherbaspirillum album TaxID=3080276 RepID=A0ABU6JIS7_9BURK|nr:hypothetical protein [Noviherbaspirillum sp. CPCC 100848]MEC4723602.1 hypothetical protein [Noviherbaspirillum sp. CPCC 100848]
MRSTKASAAITRLNARDMDYRYSLGINAAGLFYLLRAAPGAKPEKVSDDMPLDEFVQLVNQTGPQKKVKVSKLDVAFEKQLADRSRRE